jgi:aspartate/methionine/tyrosine aminotransferase
MIDALRRLKSNLDSGIPQAIQQAAIEALTDQIEDRAQAHEQPEKGIPLNGPDKGSHYHPSDKPP